MVAATCSMSMPPSEETISTGPPAAAIDDRAQIKLAGDRAAFFDQHAVDGLAFRPGLDGDQLMAEDVGGHGFGLFAAADKLHAALRGDVLDGSLAAPAGMDLGLDDGHRPGQLDEGVDRSLGGVGHEPAGHRHARLAKDLLGLEFVNFHGGYCLLWKEERAYCPPACPSFSNPVPRKDPGK